MYSTEATFITLSGNLHPYFIFNSYFGFYSYLFIFISFFFTSHLNLLG